MIWIGLSLQRPFVSILRDREIINLRAELRATRDALARIAARLRQTPKVSAHSNASHFLRADRS